MVLKFAFHRHPPAPVWGLCPNIFIIFLEKKCILKKKLFWFFWFLKKSWAFYPSKMIIREYIFIKTHLGYKGVKPTWKKKWWFFFFLKKKSFFRRIMKLMNNEKSLINFSKSCDGEMQISLSWPNSYGTVMTQVILSISKLLADLIQYLQNHRTITFR